MKLFGSYNIYQNYYLANGFRQLHLIASIYRLNCIDNELSIERFCLSFNFDNQEEPVNSTMQND